MRRARTGRVVLNQNGQNGSASCGKVRLGVAWGRQGSVQQVMFRRCLQRSSAYRAITIKVLQQAEEYRLRTDEAAREGTYAKPHVLSRVLPQVRLVTSNPQPAIKPYPEDADSEVTNQSLVAGEKNRRLV